MTPLLPLFALLTQNVFAMLSSETSEELAHAVSAVMSEGLAHAISRAGMSEPAQQLLQEELLYRVKFAPEFQAYYDFEFEKYQKEQDLVNAAENFEKVVGDPYGIQHNPLNVARYRLDGLTENSLVATTTADEICDYGKLCKDIYNLQDYDDPLNSKLVRSEADDLFCHDRFAGYQTVRVFYRNFGIDRDPITGHVIYTDDMTPRIYREISGAILYSSVGRHLVIVFKGTQSLSDWGSNLSFIRKSDVANAFGQDGIYLHKGFYDQVMDQLEPIQEGIKEATGSSAPLRVTVTGHSLGGAMSSILAYYLKTAYFANKDVSIENITFASPRVFSKASAQLVEAALGRFQIIRVWNNDDIVPQVPQGGLGFKHVGMDIVVDSNFGLGIIGRTVAHILDPFFRIIFIHSMITYSKTVDIQLPWIMQNMQKARNLALEKAGCEEDVQQADSKVQAKAKELALRSPIIDYWEHEHVLQELCDKLLYIMQDANITEEERKSLSEILSDLKPYLTEGKKQEPRPYQFGDHFKRLLRWFSSENSKNYLDQAAYQREVEH